MVELPSSAVQRSKPAKALSTVFPSHTHLKSPNAALVIYSTRHDRPLASIFMFPNSQLVSLSTLQSRKLAHISYHLYFQAKPLLMYSCYFPYLVLLETDPYPPSALADYNPQLRRIIPALPSL